MKTVIQRVSHAKVSVNEKITGEINKGFLIFLGVGKEDTEEQADYLVSKISNMRIFSDENDKMNLSIKDISGEILVVSQFTLYADCKKGNRPNFMAAGDPEKAEVLYNYFSDQMRAQGLTVANGIFGADMQVDLCNDGPVTIILERL